MKRYDDSLKESLEVLRIDKDNVKGLYRKAVVEETKGHHEEALKTIEVFKKLND